MLIRRTYITLFCALLLWSTALFSQSKESSEALAFGDLIEMPLEDLLNLYVVSPSQSRKKISQAPNIITVISDTQIAAMGARNLSDILKNVPGIQLLNRRNGRDMVWIRGVPSGRNTKVMLLIDGVPQREVIFGGWSPDEQVQINNIARIEIIRGPGSALYGGDAYSGMISIYTKKDVSKESVVDFGVGRFNTQRANLRTGKQLENMKWLFTARYFDTDGYEQEKDRRGKPSTHKNNSEALGFTSKLMTDKWTAAIIYDDYTTEYPLYSSQQYKSQQYKTTSTYIRHRNSFNQFEIENQLYWYHAERYFDRTINDTNGQLDFASFSQLKTDLAGLRSQWRYLFNHNHKATIGAVYESRSVEQYHETITLRNGQPVTEFESIIQRQGDRTPSANNYAIYIQQESLFAEGAFGVTAGIRLDHFEEFSSEVSPRVALTYQASEQWSSKLIWGTAFRPPTFLQQYEIRNDGNVSGNPMLTPELIETTEAEVVYHFNHHNNLTVRGFRSRLNDFIQSVGGAPYANINQVVSVPGFEAEWNTKIETQTSWLNQMNLSVNYTRVNSNQASLAKDNVNILLFAEDESKGLYLGFNYLGKRNASDSYHTRVTEAGSRSNDNKGSYWIVDANLRFKNIWGSRWQVDLGLKNLFDKQHYNPTFAPDSYYDVRKEPLNAELVFSYRF